MYVFLGMAAVEDLRSRRIPNPLLWGMFGVRCVFGVLERNGEAFLWDIGRACLVMGLLLFLVWLSRGSLGMGDVKLMGSLALYEKLWNVYSTFLFALVFAAPCSLYWLLSGKKQRKSCFPFAPFLFVGFVFTKAAGGFG